MSCGVYVDVSTIRKFAAQVRWYRVLPLAMVLITAALLVIADGELSRPNPTWRVHNDMKDHMNPPAITIARIINGPGYGFSGPIPGGALHGYSIRLFWVLVFWTFVGLALERRLQCRYVIQRNWVRLLLCLTGLLCSGYILWLDGWNYWLSELAITQSLGREHLFWPIKTFGVWAPVFDRLITLLWTLGFLMYFASKLWAMLPWHHHKKADLLVTT